jgi:integrase
MRPLVFVDSQSVCGAQDLCGVKTERMPMLTEVECKNATCPPERPRLRLTDANGLYLEITPKGSKRWFWKFRKGNSDTRLALGVYPAVSLSAARKGRDALRTQRAQGEDPAQARKAEKLRLSNPDGDNFKSVALGWFAIQESGWSESHAKRTRRNLEKDLFPFIGAKQMTEIHPMELMQAVKKVEERGAPEAARRVLDTAGQVFTHWLPMAPPQYRNITEGLKARLTPRIKGRFAAITEPGRFGELMRAIRVYKGGPLVRVALQLAPLLWQRPGNLRAMEWAELDLDAALWTIPSAKMKRIKMDKEHGLPHVVPLPTQAVALLQSLQPLTGGGKYVFPGERSHDRPLSDNSVRSALYALGFGKEQTWHGFRASAKTMMLDELDLDDAAIEANLAHAVKDANGRSYNRTQYIKKRFDQIQLWANYVDQLAEGNVIDLKANRAA